MIASIILLALIFVVATASIGQIAYFLD
jgi:hypothetical protein